MQKLVIMSLFFLVFYMSISIFLANVTHQLDISNDYKYNISANTHYNSLINIGDSKEKLLWFVQISDMHISKFQSFERLDDLKEFCCNTVKIINPTVVIASGDLTDGKNKYHKGASQQIEEWISYRDTVQSCMVTEKYVWLDIRGNHDNFNVPGWESKLNYFRKYSIQGKENPRSYISIIEKDGEKYAFLGVDSCLNPGPKPPFNFVGLLTGEHVDEIRTLLQKVKEMNVNHTIWFGHYPTSFVLSLASDSLRKIIGDEDTTVTYLCGHLHQMRGVRIKDMYTLQLQGFLELELGDWKDNRIFRVAAIDHGLFSFVDVRHGQWPIVLVTNPKHALYSMPEKEPLHLMKSSTHIRILTFSISSIASVEVKFANTEWINCTHVDGPLYVAPWKPSDAGEGINTLYVRVRDIDGRESIVEHPFSLDGSKMKFNILSKIILMMDASIICQWLFGTMLMICVLPLIVLKAMHHNAISGKWKMINIKDNLFYGILRKLWLLSSVEGLFYPLILYEIYFCIGPWCVGELIDGYWGVVFSWGILVDGTFIPGADTYMFGFYQLLVCQFPMTLILAHTLDRRFQYQWCRKQDNNSSFVRSLHHIPFVCIMYMNMKYAYTFWVAYGIVAIVLGPLTSWSIFLNFYLWYKTVNLPPSATWEASKLWVTPRQISEMSENTVKYRSKRLI